MSEIVIRPALAADRGAIFAVESAAFDRRDEAELVERIVADGDAVLELVAVAGDVVAGHVLFSRLRIEGGSFAFEEPFLPALPADPHPQSLPTRGREVWLRTPLSPSPLRQAQERGGVRGGGSIDEEPFAALALAPLAVSPNHQGKGVGAALVGQAHGLLQSSGERLSVVLGEPAYYGRFGYGHARAAGFESAYQGEALQALAWGSAPAEGRLVYPRAFGD